MIRKEQQYKDLITIAFDLASDFRKRFRPGEIHKESHIQEFLDSRKFLEFFDKLSKAFQEKTGGVSLDIGWIAIFYSTSPEYKDWGKNDYRFRIGKKTSWKQFIGRTQISEIDKSLHAKSRPWSTRRIYYQEAISTADILKNRTTNPGVIFEIRSRDSAWLSLHKKIHLPLPIIHCPVWHLNTPIGFVTLRLLHKKFKFVKRYQTQKLLDSDTKNDEKEIIRERIRNNKQILKRLNIFEKGRGKKRKTNFYELSTDYAEPLRILLGHLIEPILLTVKESESLQNNKKSINSTFSEEFITLLDKNRKILKNLSFYPIIDEFMDYVEKGFCSPEDLGMKIVYELWSEKYKNFFSPCDKTRTTEIIDVFRNLQEAQKALFWIPEYREHFIHSVKVFLLGSIIFAKLKSYKIAVNKRRSEFAWAAASTFHDIAIPLQKISPFIRGLLDKFLHQTRGEETVPNITTTNHILDARSITYLHLLHKTLKSKPQDRVEYATELLERGIVDDDFLNYYKRTGDHGIASSFVFLLYSLPTAFPGDNLNDILTNRIEAQGLAASKKELEKEYNTYLLIAKAIACHGLMLQTDFPNRDKYAKDFGENILLYLLILSDYLQDWGRPGGIESQVRPFCEVLDINYKKETLYIKVKYCWIFRDKNNLIKKKVNVTTCNKKNEIRKRCKDYLDGKSKCGPCGNGSVVRDRILQEWKRVKECFFKNTTCIKTKIIFCDDEAKTLELRSEKMQINLWQ